MSRDMIDPKALTHDLGGKWYGSYGTAPCPVCQPERRRDQNALGVTVEGERLLMNCKKSGCDFRDILVAAGIRPGHVELDMAAIERARQEREAEELNRIRRARSIWDAAQPIRGTKGEAYLRARGITCPLPDALRWRPDLYHKPSGTFCAAILADVSTGAIHRTFFTKQGVRLDKATGTWSHKMMLGATAGGHVALTEAMGPLVVAEGIETGLSLASGLLGGPATVWAALSTSGMRGVRLPDRPGKLIVATDGEAAGREAGAALADRAAGLGWQVSILPAPDGCDWNDVLVKKGAAA